MINLLPWRQSIDKVFVGEYKLRSIVERVLGIEIDEEGSIRVEGNDLNTYADNGILERHSVLIVNGQEVIRSTWFGRYDSEGKPERIELSTRIVKKTKESEQVFREIKKLPPSFCYLPVRCPGE